MLSAEQHDQRASGIGSSDAGAVLGLNPYCSAVDVWLEKTGAVAPPDLADNQAVHFGNVLEGVIADEYARRCGHKVRRRRATFRHRDYPWMVCHPDRTVDGQQTILECKTAGAFMGADWGASGSDDVPDQYLIQVTHQMIVMGYARADLAVLIGGRDFRVYHLTLDPELATLLIERERVFWHEHVLAGLAPEPRSSADAAALYPVDSGDYATASSDGLAAYQEMKAVRDQADALAARETALKTTLQTEMADASTLVDDAGQTLATWKKAKDSSRFDAKAFAQDHPDLHQQYQQPQSGSRRFVLK